MTKPEAKLIADLCSEAMQIANGAGNSSAATLCRALHDRLAAHSDPELRDNLRLVLDAIIVPIDKIYQAANAELESGRRKSR